MIKKGYQLSPPRHGIEVTPSASPDVEPEETSTGPEGSKKASRIFTVRYRRGAKARYTIDVRADELRARVRRANEVMREK